MINVHCLRLVFLLLLEYWYCRFEPDAGYGCAGLLFCALFVLRCDEPRSLVQESYFISTNLIQKSGERDIIGLVGVVRSHG